MIRQTRIARLIMIWGYLIMVFSFILVVILSSFISMRYITNITDPSKVLPLQTYYIYNVSKSPFYEVTFILQGFSLMTAAILYTGTDSFMGYLVFHICGQLENFRMRILNLDKFNHYEKALSSSVQDHIHLIRFRTDETNKEVNSQLNLINFAEIISNIF